MISIDIDPCPAPRQTRSDVWKKRPCVMRYRAFCDELRLKIKPEQISFPCKIVFYIKMPDSWSDKKKQKMNDTPHLSRPDFDNISKAFFDALYENDSMAWSVWVEKRWGYSGKITVKNIG